MLVFFLIDFYLLYDFFVSGVPVWIIFGHTCTCMCRKKKKIEKKSTKHKSIHVVRRARAKYMFLNILISLYLFLRFSLCFVLFLLEAFLSICTSRGHCNKNMFKVLFIQLLFHCTLFLLLYVFVLETGGYRFVKMKNILHWIEVTFNLFIFYFCLF
jgi:hypothetical protein